MSNLERAIEIAVAAHRGQVDKAGAPYILHPLRVMLAVQGDAARIVAVLHDVCEDSADWSIERLRAEGFDAVIIAALQAVTKRPDGSESYLDFVRRAGADPIGRQVKLADLADNMDMRRLPAPTEQDLARLARYRAAVALLKGREN